LGRVDLSTLAVRLLGRAAATPAAAPVRRLVNRLVGGRARVVRILSGAGRGARLELDLTREKAYWLGYYEGPVQRFLQEQVVPGAVVYDVGAHIGFVSLCAARLGARVFAFEASPENVSRLRRTAALNGLPIEVVERAVWDSDEGVALVPGASASEWRSSPGGAVPSTTLDAFASTHPAPDVVKIDVEGAEARVLRGARRLLAERRPVVVCEVHGEAQRAEVRRLLAEYDVEPLESEWRLVARPRG